jgi:uncharacterized RDD family membrane protein YckC
MMDPTAVLGRRIGAFFIDVAIALLAFVLIFFPLATKRTVAETLDLPGCQLEVDSNQVTCSNRQIVQIGDTVYEAGGATFLFDLAFVFLYFGIVAGITGATIGKLLVGIRVVQEDGSNVGVPKSLLRWVCFFVDIFLVGIILAATSRGHRRLGDMAAKTYVVTKEAVGRPIVLLAVPGPAVGMPPPPVPGPQPQWDASRGTYVQWDPATGRYLTWDEPSHTWR